MKKLKKGDEVIVITGKDKGKRGIILSVIDAGERLLIEGINLVKKHVKANPDRGEEGGVVLKAASLHHSNVMLYDAETQTGSRVGIRQDKEGKRTRFYKKSGQDVQDADVKGK